MLFLAIGAGIPLGGVTTAAAAGSVTLTITSVPAGLQVTFDGVTETTPYTRDVETGTQHTVAVASQTASGTNYAFSSWSDAGAATHQVTAPTADGTLSVTLGAAIWPDTATPAVPSVSDGQPIELGTKFRASSAGTISALRFYKGGHNDGAHIGRLWRVSDGALLAEATYSGETPVGWQQASLASPVAVQAGATYVSTLYSPDQLFPITSGYFASGALVAGPLTALQSGTDGPNGVYRYGLNAGPNPQMPVAGSSAGYFSDVVFVPPSGSADTTAPDVTAIGATPALSSATITWTTDEVATSVVRFGASSSSLDQTATTGGNTASHTVVVNGLTPGTTYYYRVESADTAGNTTTEPAGAPLTFTTTAAPNEIVSENLLQGNPASEWQVAGAGDASIQGFTTDMSASPGATVSFKVDLDATTPDFHIDVYRLGWYGGDGARKVATIGAAQTTSTDQPACLTDAAGLNTGLVDCGNWSVSATWTVPANAVSGIYIARLVRDDTQGASQVPFVVRDDSGHSNLLFQTSDTAWQAYNQYGGNSLYTGGGPGTGGSADGRAYKVSYNRPFTVRDTTPEDSLFNAEYPMVRWLEQNGYDVSYASGVDTDRAGAELLEHQAFLSVGHDEYWSGTQRANVEAARDAGVHLAFFSGNESFWKTRWENSIDASNTSHRTLVAYKETHNYPNNPDPSPEWTGSWRDPRDPQSANRPENGLSGTIFTVNCCTYDMVVPDQAGATRLWRNTSVAASPGADTLSGGLLGYEWDEDLDNGARPVNEIRMSRTTANVPEKVVPSAYGSTFGPGSATHSLTLYKATSGALVFGSGTVQWPWGLDDSHDRGNAPAIPAVQQATINLFADMGISPGSPQNGMSVTGPSTDTTAPTTAITSPLTGTTVASGTVTVQGTATDVGGSVGAVEVSTDGGSTWHPADGWSSWSYSFPSGAPGTAWTVLARGVDDSFNVGSPTSVSFTIVTQPPPTCPCTIFGDVVPTTTNDSGAYELGVRFQSSVDGVVNGVRFYKGAANTGTHVGHLWTESGTLLAGATFAGESATGWQQVSFNTPVAITAGTNYIASYSDPNGNYGFAPNFFTNQAAISGVLTAPQSTGGARNGVFFDTPGLFPTLSYNDSNYYVDVVFDQGSGPDVTAPTIAARVPNSGASGVATTSPVRVTFDEQLDATSVNDTTVLLRGPTAPVAATVTYESTTRTAVLMPSAPLQTQTQYTVTVRGGSDGVKDGAGNALAADSTWTYTTAAPPPDSGPGGPIAIITNPTDPFSRYYAEILRAEGLNAFELVDLDTLDAARLSSYKAAILGRTTLTPAQVSLLTNWVQAGGDLVAMQPDAQLASLLGLTSVAGAVANAYLAVDTSAAPGSGITAQTMQFHGSADRYTLAGATAVATLYVNATTSTANPAVTTRVVGTNGGHASAFTFDLARSVVLTRQGNPAWAGQERDGQPGLRPDDLFFGNAAGDPQPDWVDLNKVAIPQADEQQRLLANVLETTTKDQLPLPRLWYLPRGQKAAVVMTGDDHGGNGTAGRFDDLASRSPAGCDVAAWQCVRGTSYVYPGVSLTDAQVAAYQSAGFEVGLHPNTGCDNPWTEASLRNVFTTQLTAMAADRPSLLAPVSSRTHCIAWSDWATQPKVERDYGVRLDTNYYYWPASWIDDRPGVFTGSGFPMRFADTDGSMIDVYQAPTQMTDESGQSYPSTANALLDRALGAEGYYGTFAANIHTDSATPQANTDIVNAALARGVPVISAKQLLTWLDGRNSSSFQNLAFNGSDLTFTMAVGAGADGLQAMLPITGGSGSLTTLRRDSSPVTFTQRDVKGVTYAMFDAAPGVYTATYTADITPPVISAVTVTPKSTSATIAWTTDEPATSQVQFGTDGGTLSQGASSPGLTTSHSVSLAGLAPSSSYFYRLTSADGRSNSTTTPDPPATPSQFTTRGPEVEDTTLTDFSAGTRSGTVVTSTGDGAVALGSSTAYDFAGATLPAGLTAGPAWTSGGTANVTGGALAVDGTVVRSSATFGAGSSVEFDATFAAAPFQHIGYGTDLDSQPWAFFSTKDTTNTLYARTKTASSNIDTPLTPTEGSYIGGAHRYRIEWGASAVHFYIDGALVQTHAATIGSPMQAVASDYATGGPALSVDALTLSTRPSSGTFTSRVLDAGSTAAWSKLTATGSTPAGTTESFETRAGNTASPDGSWSTWAPPGASAQITSPYARFIQYRATLGTTDLALTPEVESVALAYARTGTVTALVAIVPADTHKVVALLDGVPIGSPLGQGDPGPTAPFPAGTHTMSVTGSGETNVANYTVLFFGSCAVDGTLTIPVGGSVTCVALLIHKALPLPTVSISDPQVVRPSSGTAQAVFTVTRSGLTFFPITVNYATQDGTAKVATGDYTAKSGTLTFDPSGPSTQTVSVPISATARHGVSDSFNLVLSGVSAATFADNVGTAQLINRNGPISVSASDVDHIRSTTATTTANFTLSLSAAPAAGEQVTVQVNTTNGTATAVTDYTAVPLTTVTFAAGQQTKTVAVTVAKKSKATVSRTFNLVLQNASGNAVLADSTAVAGLRSTGTTTPPPTAYISDTALVRPASGTTSAVFTVSLSAASTATVTVPYTTQDGTAAVSTGDYTAKSGTVTFTPGQLSKTVSVTVSPTARHALTTSFNLVLSPPTGATLADSSGTARLIGLYAPIGISAADIAVVRWATAGTTATVTVSLSAAPAAGETVTVNVATANSTAIAGVDYSALATTVVTFTAGELSKTVTVPVLARPTGTPTRIFTLALSAPSPNALIADAASAVSLIGP